MSVVLGRVGIWTSTLDALEVPAARDAVGELDEQGWGSLWFGEAYGREAFSAAALCLAASSRIVVGTGIASIYARDAMARASRTLAAAFPDRFVLGLGVSHAPMVERMRGHEYGRPVAAMSTYLDAVDAAPYMVAGAAAPPPRVLAALGPRMLGLARDRAQGAHPYLTTPGHTAQARTALGGTAEDGPLLVVEQAAVLSDDVETWRSRAHAHLESYTGLPNYRASWLRQGLGEDDAVRGGSDRLKTAMVSRGLDGTAARVREHLDAGATTVVVQVLGEHAFDVPRADWARLAGALL